MPAGVVCAIALLSLSRANGVCPWRIAAVIATFGPFSKGAVSCRVTHDAMPHTSHLDMSQPASHRTVPRSKKNIGA
jgi:hypothetical protein